MPSTPKSSPHVEKPTQGLASARPDAKECDKLGIDRTALAELLGRLYGYARYIVGRYSWRAIPVPNYRELAHDAMVTACENLAGLSPRRVWDAHRIDLEIFARGHIRSNVWKIANSADAKTRQNCDEIQFFRGTPIDEHISLTNLRLDLYRSFSDNSMVMPVLAIIFRDICYSRAAISHELGWSDKEVERAWKKITVVARALSE
jgi:hypothetical protein